jgi:hypothetical protein
MRQHQCLYLCSMCTHAHARTHTHTHTNTHTHTHTHTHALRFCDNCSNSCDRLLAAEWPGLARRRRQHPRFGIRRCRREPLGVCLGPAVRDDFVDVSYAARLLRIRANRCRRCAAVGATLPVCRRWPRHCFRWCVARGVAQGRHKHREPWFHLRWCVAATPPACLPTPCGVFPMQRLL